MQIRIYLKVNNNESIVVNVCRIQVKQYEQKKGMALNTNNTKEERMKSNEISIQLQELGKKIAEKNQNKIEGSK